MFVAPPFINDRFTLSAAYSHDADHSFSSKLIDIQKMIENNFSTKREATRRQDSIKIVFNEK